MICPSCGAEGVVREVLDAVSGIIWEDTTCPKCHRVLLTRQQHPPRAPRRSVDDGDEE